MSETDQIVELFLKRGMTQFGLFCFDRPDNLSDEQLLALEQAINTHSDFRAHVDTAVVPPRIPSDIANGMAQTLRTLADVAYRISERIEDQPGDTPRDAYWRWRQAHDMLREAYRHISLLI